MSIALTFEYRYLFNAPRPDPQELLKDIPSKFVIAILSTVNDTLTLRGYKPGTQKFLLINWTINFPKDIRDDILAKAIPKIDTGYELFAFPYTVEFINRELIHYREIISKHERDNSIDELNIFKAYVAIVDEMIEKDVLLLQKSIADAKRGG
jgi:hypothetical protein